MLLTIDKQKSHPNQAQTDYKSRDCIDASLHDGRNVVQAASTDFCFSRILQQAETIDEMVVPTDLHRIYTQTLLARRVMRQEVALELYARAVEICKRTSMTLLFLVIFPTACAYATITDVLPVVNDDYEPVHPMNTQGLNGFLHEVSTFLEEVGMTISTGKEETGSGKGWVVLVS